MDILILILFVSYLVYKVKKIKIMDACQPDPELFLYEQRLYIGETIGNQGGYKVIYTVDKCSFRKNTDGSFVLKSDTSEFWFFPEGFLNGCLIKDINGIVVQNPKESRLNVARRHHDQS